MKTILFLRAGATSVDSQTPDDPRRSITRRGEVDALRIGEIMKNRELIPEVMLTSPALRARQTAALIGRQSGYRGPVTPVKELYGASLETLLEIIVRLPDELDRVMIVGHSPGVKLALNRLTGWGKTFPANALAYLVIPIHTWGEVGNDGMRAVLVELWHPSKPACSYFMDFMEIG
ncbi:MAG TPA: histidine phosphatase family protein [Anaerolineaceae bacterium]|jgi:phosphohistidine phosphatase